MKSFKRSKTTYGTCRCCLSEGKHRNIMMEHYDNGVREVYFDLFLECFNLFLATSKKLSTLICYSCVEKLREAVAFRSMVLDNETKMLEVVNDDVFVTVLVPVEEDICANEDDKEEIQMEIFDHGGDEECPAIVEEVEPIPELVSGEEALLARFSASTLRSLPTATTLCQWAPGYARQLDRLKGKKINPDMIPKLMMQNKLPKTLKNKLKRDACLIRDQIRTLIECTNMTPFKSRYGHGFTCIFCSTTLDTIQQLKNHQNIHKGNLRQIMPKGKNENLVVYADVTDLKCKLCDISVKDLNEIKDHLIKSHKKSLGLKQDRIVPFKIVVDKEFECQICSAPFPNLGAIKTHMNVHYKYYICDVCGSGFMTKFRLETHINTRHSSKVFSCNQCDKQLTSYSNYRIHLNLVHKKLKNIKCHVKTCTERFQDYFSRRKHMISCHEANYLNYMCSICEKKFNRRYALSLHMKRTHIAEKNFECAVCSYRCFSKGELNFHMIKHTGEKIYECEFCKKMYARKKTLKEHLRIHNNDRRFVCSVCGQAFVQNCSLKGHMKTHHPEYAID